MTATAESDLRFQYEVIKGLSESLRQTAIGVERLTTTVAAVQQTQMGMMERLARIEANRVNEDVARNSQRIDALAEQVDKLEQDRDIREGGARTRRAVQSYWGIITSAIAGIGTVLFLILRTIGIIHLPSDETKPPIVVPIERQARAPDDHPIRIPEDRP